MASAPIIGISTYLEPATCGVWDTRASFLHEAYLQAVLDAGGVPVLLPPQPSESDRAAQVIAKLDGLILAGGADVNPARYGEQPHEKTGAPRDDRDDWEVALYVAARSVGRPILAICRGMQIVNTVHGGTLLQHLPDIVGSDLYQPAPGVFGSVDITISEGSALANILGSSAHDIPVYHHQAVGKVGSGLAVTATTSDGTIQALECPSALGFFLAVQWHPEQQHHDRRLFEALVNATPHTSKERP
ncbi:peptidase C26 [Mycobacteroides abscessus subsp. abscessus]|uniref:gamma-glutamyl-gamma-aminobutyrate hydrolase family protein n=1 Tax=Dermabacter sp. HSID17554 TaxID=2419511 RepID=UPI00092B8DEA|nr:gamma-glutamyl-gamma-aminobutyrate hydrolase family protein [Dermabacter sp. HSID17554]RUP85455.1 gamma-glutamyl-gamma-aminobutyrate hydrolase family protein [Dermabacter sp. HSID17554]SHY32139.1 peptidase C26 [Mycobacteroides abscessus subsp. abscessus]